MVILYVGAFSEVSVTSTVLIVIVLPVYSFVSLFPVKVTGRFVIVSFALSYASVHLPVISGMSQGNRTILLTIVISAVFAALFPRQTEDPEGGAADAD